MLVIIRLVNGVDVAGEIVHEDVRGLTLRYPLQINYKSSFGGYPTTSFVKYQLFMAADEVPFDRHNILHVFPVRQTFEAFYKKALDKFYFKLTEVVDSELSFFVTGSTMQESDSVSEDTLVAMLEDLSTDKMTMN